MPSSRQPDPSRADRPATATASLAALGIVYGDLGTSPLYTYQAIVGAAGGHPSAADALGLLSLVVWALLITVSLKYCVFVMRADNHGEGGILALMSLVTGRAGHSGHWRSALIVMGLFGAALIYGDGVITPAISVLSALEGINVVTETFKPYVLPAAIVVLLGLFAIQSRGTASIGKVFGPVMALWFATIAVLGGVTMLQHLEVLAAIDPRHAIGFLFNHGWQSFVVLGGVFLAITGGEALYADMGHIGRNPIRFSWYAFVLPALLLSYAGQTALLIEHPDLQGNPFFQLAPHWAVVPLVVLATFATIIASQAIITGAFSLTRQAMQLGWLPGLQIRQTSADEYGQIYVPFVNWAMMLGTLLLAYTFGSSDKLAGAYGTAVSTTMLLTTGLLYNTMRGVWRWGAFPAAAVSIGLLVVDLAFFGANLLKLRDGGWIPLLLGAVIFILMRTWHTGAEAVRQLLLRDQKHPAAFLAELANGRIPRVPGTAVFLSRSNSAVPRLMVRHVAQMKALPETVISLNVHFEPIPRVTSEKQVQVHKVAEGLWQVSAHFGFVEIPSITAALARAREHNCPIDLEDAVYFASRDEVARSPNHPRLAGWQRLMFGFMYRNAIRASDRFDFPGDRLIDVGRQISL